MVNVAVIVGSLRRESINRKLALALQRMGKAHGLDLALADISDLPQYNDDLWPNPPEPVTRLKRTVEAADAILFVTPEYNRGVPGPLKNAIDWGSRPKEKNSWAGKPGAIAGASGGKIGTAVAQSQLRNTLVVLDVALMGQPEAYLMVLPSTIRPDFTLADESFGRFLDLFLRSFAEWIGKVAGIVPQPGQPDAEPVHAQAAA